MKKFLCVDAPKCLHSKQELIRTVKPLWSTSQRVREVEELQILCLKSGKYIHHYVTQCNYYFVGITLFTVPKKPQWLETVKENFNECSICKGKGYVVIKIPNEIQKMTKDLDGKIKGKRFERENCDYCKNKGIITKLR